MDCHWNFFRVRKILNDWPENTNSKEGIRKLCTFRVGNWDADCLKELDNSLTWTQERPSACKGFVVPIVRKWSHSVVSDSLVPYGL